MGSCLSRANNQVADLDTTSYPDVVVERITHITADIHEKIRKRMPKKDAGESLKEREYVNPRSDSTPQDLISLAVSNPAINISRFESPNFLLSVPEFSAGLVLP